MAEEKKVNTMSVELAIQRELAYRKKVNEACGLTRIEMSEERKVNIMSVELAIRRELAYRKKVANLFAESEVDIMEDLLPLETSTTISSPNQSPRHLLGRSSISTLNHQCLFQYPPCRTPSSTPTPGASMGRSHQAPSSIGSSKPSPVQSQDPSPCRWPSLNMASTQPVMETETTASNLLYLPYQQPQPCSIGSTTYLLCKVYKVSCSGPLSYNQHLKGQKHKAKLRMLQLSREGGRNKKHQQPRCNLCQIWCSDENSLESHLKGQKHKAKLQEIELGQKGKTSQPL